MTILTSTNKRTSLRLYKYKKAPSLCLNSRRLQMILSCRFEARVPTKEVTQVEEKALLHHFPQEQEVALITLRVLSLQVETDLLTLMIKAGIICRNPDKVPGTKGLKYLDLKAMAAAVSSIVLTLIDSKSHQGS